MICFDVYAYSCENVTKVNKKKTVCHFGVLPVSVCLELSQSSLSPVMLWMSQLHVLYAFLLSGNTLLSVG